MRKNKITNLSEIKYLKNLDNLKVLWLWDNPCCENPHYRQYIIKMLPSLEKLDNAVVNSEEKLLAKKLDLSTIENEDVRSMSSVDDMNDDSKRDNAK